MGGVGQIVGGAGRGYMGRHSLNLSRRREEFW